jgi:hypothetical protein
VTLVELFAWLVGALAFSFGLRAYMKRRRRRRKVSPRGA